MGKVLKCPPEVAERLSRRLLKKGLVVGIVREGERISHWAKKADVVLIVKDGKTRGC